MGSTVWQRLRADEPNTSCFRSWHSLIYASDVGLDMVRVEAGALRKAGSVPRLVEQVSPGPYLEMFARRNRLGWDTWGNEALEHVQVSAS
jgi:N6-adenosine-specific RNA methylase IME4